MMDIITGRAAALNLYWRRVPTRIRRRLREARQKKKRLQISCCVGTDKGVCIEWGGGGGGAATPCGPHAELPYLIEATTEMALAGVITQSAASASISGAVSSKEKRSISSLMYSGVSAAVTIDMFCCTSHRRATCAGETPCFLPIEITSGSSKTLRAPATWRGGGGG